MKKLNEDWDQMLGTSGMRFGMDLMHDFGRNEGQPMDAADLFPDEVQGMKTPPHYWAYMIHECKFAELRGRELWHESGPTMELHCRDVGQAIVDAYSQWEKQWGGS